MKIIETVASVTANGRLTASVSDLTAGQYKVAVHVEEPALSTNAPLFSDIQNHWAKPFIEALAAKKIISGFPDGTFKPNNIVNRAQFAALASNAFSLLAKRQPIQFTDIPAGYWAAAAINKTYVMGFLSGYPNQQFRPNAGISKAQVIVALVNGLEVQSPDAGSLELAGFYQDWSRIPSYAKTQVAIATEKGMVVNYPDLKRLEPNRSATRAEVAAMLYQALVQQGEMPAIASNAIVAPQSQSLQTVKTSHQREFRGVWAASVWNLDWPSKKGLSTAKQQEELIQILDRMASLNLNALILQIRPEGDALYASAVDPWSAWLSGTQGKPPEPFYDPLDFALKEAHKRNIELHAWFNPYRAKVSALSPANILPHIDAVHPTSVYPYGTQRWMDPGKPEIQNRTYNAILDVVRHYDVDGVHLDDYFYPYPIASEPFPDSPTYQAYRDGGGTLSLGDWRRNNVNQFVERLSQGIRATKPHVKFGISPFGIYRPNEPPGIQGLDQYDQLFADPKKWLAEGWIDYIAPQLYWRIDQTQQSYPTLLKWWTENNPRNAHIYVGNNLRSYGQPSWTFEEFEQQVAIARNQAANNALGNIFFNMAVFSANPDNINARFGQNIYPKPALAPVIPTVSAPPPPLPAGVRAGNGTISWNAAAKETVRAWTLYRSTAGSWELVEVFPASTTSASVSPGTYAVCAVNRIAQESEGVAIALPQ